MPAEESDLVVWSAFRQDAFDRSTQARWLCADPTFFLLALAGFQFKNRRRAKTIDELLSWWSELPPTAIQLSPPTKSSRKLAASRLKYLAKWRRLLEKRAATKPLHRTLRKYLKALAGNAESVQARKVLKRILAKPLLLELCSRVATPNAFAQSFMQRSKGFDSGEIATEKTPSPVPGNSSNADSQSEQDFQRRLQVEKLAALRQLAYGASHEINNPLANIAMRAEMLLRGEQDPDRKRKLTVIRQQAMRAHEMISDMMLFANPPKLKPERLDLSRLLNRVTEELRGQALASRSQFEIDVQPGVETVADATQLAESLKAILWNSMESQPDGGTIQVTAKVETSGETIIVVTDQGQGISDAIARHMFDPFFSGREAGRGLGFGLSKAWRIAGLHGGQLICRSRQPGKTVFEIRWPKMTAESFRQEAA